MDRGLDGGGASLTQGSGQSNPRAAASAVRSGAARFVVGALWLPPLAFFAIFYFYPLVRITTLSFARAEGPALGAFLEAAGSTAALRALRFTLWQASVSTLLTLGVGLPGAYFLARYTFRGKAAIRSLTAVPFVLPTLVVAAAFDALAGPRGLVNQALMAGLGLTSPPLHFMNTLTAILVAHVFYNTTIVLRLVGDFWSHLDPELTGAARVLGASRRQAAVGVTAPLLAPAVLAAALLVFIFDFTSFGVILVMGGPRFATLEVEIYYQTVSLFNLPLAASLSVVQLAATLGLTVIYTHVAHRLGRPLDLRSRRSAERPLVGRRARVAAMAVLGGLLLLLVAPLAALVARSVMPVARDAAAGPTLDYFRALFANPRQSAFYASPIAAVAISLAYAGATVLLALAFGLPASWILARRPRGRAVRLLDPLLMLPLGTSAVTLGLGFLVALNRPPVDLRASPLLV
ncbi:MAG: ABC transporter permease, partial [Anaerolineae bacterium]